MRMIPVKGGMDRIRTLLNIRLTLPLLQHGLCGPLTILSMQFYCIVSVGMDFPLVISSRRKLWIELGKEV